MATALIFWQRSLPNSSKNWDTAFSVRPSIAQQLQPDV